MSCTLPGNGWPRGGGAFKKARLILLQVLLLLASERSLRVLFLSLIAVYRRIQYVAFLYTDLLLHLELQFIADTVVCVRACVCISACMYACMHGYRSVCLFVCLYVRMYVCMYVRMSVPVCMNVRLYVCMHVRLFASHMFLCMHTAMYISFVMQPFRLGSCGIGFRV